MQLNSKKDESMKDSNNVGRPHPTKLKKRTQRTAKRARLPEELPLSITTTPAKKRRKRQLVIANISQQRKKTMKCFQEMAIATNPTSGTNSTNPASTRSVGITWGKQGEIKKEIPPLLITNEQLSHCGQCGAAAALARKWKDKVFCVLEKDKIRAVYFFDEDKALWKDGGIGQLDTRKTLTEIFGKTHIDNGYNNIVDFSHVGTCHAIAKEAIRYLVENEKEALFDASPDLFPVANKMVIDLHTLKVRERTKYDMFTMESPIAWNPDADTTPSVDLFLKMSCGNKEEARFLQILGGYCTLIAGNPEQIVVVVHGEPDAAKSTFSNTCRMIAGPFGLVTKKDLFVKTAAKISAEAPNAFMAKFKGKRFVSASELSHGQALADDLIKFLTNETITVRTLNEEPFEMPVMYKIVIDTNHPPVIDGSDAGIVKRVLPIKFTARFTRDKSKVDPEKGIYELIPDFSKRFKSQGNLPGLLKFLAEGASAYLKKRDLGAYDNPFEIPEFLVNAKNTYVAHSDSIKTFFDECIEIDDHESVQASILYEQYAKWCENNLRKDKRSPNAFGITVSEIPYIIKKRTSSSIIYGGIKFKHD
jgi:P4 family phage/plasmid primase-like protien